MLKATDSRSGAPSRAGRHSQPGRKPDWLRVRLPTGPESAAVRRILRDSRLHTVCEEAGCPNVGECWQAGHATVMILGDRCTRNCGFCGVTSDPPAGVDTDEPCRVAAAVRDMGLKEVVITSVTRDDLPDGGAAIWAETIRRVRELDPHITVEALIPDFQGSAEALQLVLNAGPSVLGHNLETVPSLYAGVRPAADYARSIALLRRSSATGQITKTSLMLGLGETGDEVIATMQDARMAGVRIVYLGQYLQPTNAHVPVERYLHPDEFDAFREQGLAMGFGVVVCAPLVRSSYRSDAQSAFLRKYRGMD